jgi:sugar fermentation stimulation protein A
VRFSEPLVRGTFLSRRQRFFADVRLDGGPIVVAHCANPGSMLGVSDPGSAVYVSGQDAPGRKLAWSLEAIRVGRGWVGVHPGRANALVEEAIRRSRIPELAGYASLRREVVIGEGSRADFLLEDPRRPPCWVEVKYVTLAHRRTGLFPDSVSVRAARHVRELAARARAGDRAVLVFACPRSDVDAVGPADAIDPAYGSAFREARAAGMEALARRVRVRRRGLTVAEALPVMPGPYSVHPSDGPPC